MATEQMFCFQCEQVAKCEACTGGAGVCGKPADVADAQDALTGAMIALARTAREAGVKNDRICDLIVDGLFTCMTNVNFDGQAVTELKDAVRVETAAVAAAEQGVEYTKTIIATKGRASYLGERSLGHQDPGATSFTTMLKVAAAHV